MDTCRFALLYTYIHISESAILAQNKLSVPKGKAEIRCLVKPRQALVQPRQALVQPQFALPHHGPCQGQRRTHSGPHQLVSMMVSLLSQRKLGSFMVGRRILSALCCMTTVMPGTPTHELLIQTNTLYETSKHPYMFCGCNMF